MSSAEDCLVDALRTILEARARLAVEDVGAAIVHLCHAHRFHALALGMHPVSLGTFQANADEVNEKLGALQKEVVAAARPTRAPLPTVIDVIAEGMRPILRELATVGADPDAVVTARGRNLAALLTMTFDVRQGRE